MFREMHGSAARKSRPGFVSPMLYQDVKRLPGLDGWFYEVKRNGERAIAIKEGKEVRLLSRDGRPLNCPEARDAMRRLPAERAVIDCELVALGRGMGHEAAERPKRARGISLYAFDLLHINGRNVMEEPIERRKERLCSLTMDSALLFCPSLSCEPDLLLEEVKRLSLEGVIAKRKGSMYQPGDRSGAWVLMRVTTKKAGALENKPDDRFKSESRQPLKCRVQNVECRMEVLLKPA